MTSILPSLVITAMKSSKKGTLVGHAVVDRAARPHVGLEHLLGAHRRGVEEGEGIGVGAAGAVQLRREAGVYGRVAADPHRQQLPFIAIEASLLSASRSCRAVGLGALVPRQDRWRGRPCHVTSQQPRSSPCHPPAAPPCMTRHMCFTEPEK